MKRVLLLWYTINNNLGDVLIYETVKKALETQGIETGYMDVGEPCNKILEEANKYDFLLFAGGGIIERYIPNVIRYFEEDYAILKVPYGVIGLSIGAFNYEKYEHQIRFWTENAQFFYARDDYTANYLNRLCHCDHVVHGVDVVWANQRICTAHGIKQDGIGINVRDVPYKDIQDDMDWTKLKSIIKKLNINTIIPDESDQSIKENLYDEEQREKYTVDSAIRSIQKCRILIAMRYHVVLIAVANGIPVVPITYCQKVGEIAKQVGLEKYALKIEELDNLEDIFERMKCNVEYEQLHLKKRYCEMKYKADEMLNAVSKQIISG